MSLQSRENASNTVDDPISDTTFRSRWRRMFGWKTTQSHAFDLESYLESRARSPLEKRFHDAVQKASRGALTVEDVQRMCDRYHSKVEVMHVLLMQLDLKSQREADRFTHLFTRLWENTPRTDLNGATPAQFQRGESESSREGRRRRNDPCVCGSGKKYKQCCG